MAVDTRSIRVLGLLVAVVLLALLFYPGTLAAPYLPGQETVQYSHAVTPESTERYAEHTEALDPPVYEYHELSPEAQELFDRTRESEAEEFGWEHRYTPTICAEFMLVCDGYFAEDLPEEFTYGEDLTPDEAFLVIEDGDGRYLLKTGDLGHGDMIALPVRELILSLSLLPLALFLALSMALPIGHRFQIGSVGAGIGVATLAVSAPYLELLGLVAVQWIAFGLLGAIWLGFLLLAGAFGFRTVQRHRSGPPDRSD